MRAISNLIVCLVGDTFVCSLFQIYCASTAHPFMPPLRAPLAQSESKARFFERLGLNEQDENHRRLYAMMKVLEPRHQAHRLSITNITVKGRSC